VHDARFSQRKSMPQNSSSGFGLGLERLLVWITGMGNVRDVIPFPRVPGTCKF